jgi:hypothetical protein
MTNRIALGLGVTLLGLFCLDAFAFDWTASLFLGSKLVDFIDYIAFWR